MITDEIKRKIRSDYVHRRMPATTIAALQKISPSTIGRMKKAAKKKGDDWDAARSASIIAGQGMDTVVSTIVEDFLLQAQALQETIKDDELSPEAKVKCLIGLADAMIKMTSAAKRLAPKISELGVAQDVLKQMLEFVREEYPHHADAILEIVEPFGDQLTTRFG